MPALRSQPSPAATHSPQAEAMARNLERIAWLMDRAIPIPGTKLRVGLDAILGLMPGAGDYVSGLVQIGVVLTALKHYKVPKAVAMRMVGNVLLDTIAGSIPVVGDLFDAGFKANTRNLALLGSAREAHARGQVMGSASSVRFLVIVGLFLLGVLTLMALGCVYLAVLIYKALTTG